MESKTCSKCGETKPHAEFPKHSGHKDGFGSQCKVCRRLADAEYRRCNPTKNKDDYAKRMAENPNYHAERYAKDPERAKSTVAKWQKENPEKRRELHRRFRANNPDYYKEWPKRDPEKTKERRQKQYERRQSTPKGRLENSVKVGVYKGLKRGVKAGRKTFDLLGYTADELRIHLERLFQPGMTWENYGEWHVDHKVPLAAHNYDTPDDIDFKKAWALSNLQPLWERDNLSKNAKLSAPFQPSLALAA